MSMSTACLAYRTVLDHRGAPGDAHPPHRRPIFVAMIDHELDVPLSTQVLESPQLHRQFRLRIHDRHDPTAVHREADRDRARPPIPSIEASRPTRATAILSRASSSVIRPYWCAQVSGRAGTSDVPTIRHSAVAVNRSGLINITSPSPGDRATRLVADRGNSRRGETPAPDTWWLD